MLKLTDEAREDGRQLLLWLFAGAIVELTPTWVLVVSSMFSKDQGIRDTLGYSTPILIAFAILMMAVCEVLIDGAWRRAGDFSAAFTLAILIVICQLSGWAITQDAQIRSGSRELLREPRFWLLVELGVILTLLLWSARMKAWLIGLNREKLARVNDGAGTRRRK